MPAYCSIDLRYSGFKLAPVDTNLFPAGFNNLSPDNISHAVCAAQQFALHYNDKSRKILILPENHTKNIFYFESLAVLQSIFQQAGFEVRMGTLLTDIQQPKNIQLPSGRTLILEPALKSSHRLTLEKFNPDLILLNHDLSDGIPEILKNIEQEILPSPTLGWWSRKKSHHFNYYQQIINLFAHDFSLDPWLINAYFDTAKNIDFLSENHENEQNLIDKTCQIFSKIEKKYQEHHIKLPPYVVIKSDSGTYGMGILIISDPEKLRYLNRKERAKMGSTKGNQKIDQVMIQEGVYTVETYGSDQRTAEPVIYMIENHIIGGFYRTHQTRQYNDNLNTPGMTFEPVNIFKEKFFEAYKIISQLVLLAASHELQENFNINTNIQEYKDNKYEKND